MPNRKFRRISIESKAMVRTTLEIPFEAITENLSRKGLFIRLELSFEAFTENLSLNGLFIRTERRLPVGTRAEIMLEIPSASRSSSFTIYVTVVRNNFKGVAFRFGTLDQDSFSHLQMVIWKKSPNHLKEYYPA
ncbi:MAG TPA: PilZ domain-containing protein [Geobacteraceae bacterium]|nr:PilZ domain-containing protein [Geobacteraceae bacterium]